MSNVQVSARAREAGAYRGPTHLNPLQYVGRNLFIGLTLEAAARYFDLVKSNPLRPDVAAFDVLSLKRFTPPKFVIKTVILEQDSRGAIASSLDKWSITVSSYFNAVKDWFDQTPQANGQTVPPSAPDSTEILWKRASQILPLEETKRYVAENWEWLAVTTAMVSAFSITNYFTANRIKNAPLRNLVSTAAAVSVTSFAIYAKGSEVAVDRIVDIGFRFIAGQTLVTCATPIAGWTLRQCENLTQFLGKPLSF